MPAFLRTSKTQSIGQGCKGASTVSDAQKSLDLSSIALEGGPSFCDLAEQARRSQVNGHILQCPNVWGLRLRAIEWLSCRFNDFGYRDEWLAETVNYMDRAAVLWCINSTTGTPSSPSSDAPQEVICKAAKEVMACNELWLAAVQVALKMSEAESELDSTVYDLVMPLASFGQASFRLDRLTWNRVLQAEFKLVEKLDFRLVVPNALRLVDHLAYEVVQAISVDTVCWAGLGESFLPLLRGPPSKCKELEKERLNKAMPKRNLTHFQALARFLAEAVLVHKPGDAYADRTRPCALAIAVVRLALHSFGGAGPPKPCTAVLANIEAQMATSDKHLEELLPNLLRSIYTLWSWLPQTSPVLKKWRARLGDALPSAPGPGELPFVAPRITRRRWAAGVLKVKRRRWAAGILQVRQRRWAAGFLQRVLPQSLKPSRFSRGQKKRSRASDRPVFLTTRNKPSHGAKKSKHSHGTAAAAGRLVPLGPRLAARFRSST